MLSRSGETDRPSTSRSSPTFPITVTSRGSTAATSPRAKRAPPTPPESKATFTLADELAEGRLGARACPEAEPIEILERVDVVGEVRDRSGDDCDALRLGMVAEAGGAAAAVERREERGARERERVRRSVRCLHEPDRAEVGGARERAQVVRDDAGNVRVQDDHDPVVRLLERDLHRRSLAAAGIVDRLGSRAPRRASARRRRG